MLETSCGNQGVCSVSVTKDANTAQDKSRSTSLLSTVVLGIISELQLKYQLWNCTYQIFLALKKVLHVNGL